MITYNLDICQFAENVLDGCDDAEMLRAFWYAGEDHDKRCVTACLDCLLSFDAQRFMAQWPFARREALRALDGLLQSRG